MNGLDRMPINISGRLPVWIGIAVLAVLIGGCSATPEKTPDPFAAQMVLAQAGFKFKIAETPEEIAELKALPQKTIFQHPHEDQQWYVYADADGCGCLYYGDETNYQRLRKSVRDEKEAVRRGYVLEEKQRTAIEGGMAPQINWDRWEY